MLKKVIVGLGTAVLLSACSMMGSMGGNVPAELISSQDNLVKNYVTATTLVLEGQKNIAAALNIKENLITDLDNQITSLKSGNLTTSEIDKNTELANSVNAALTKQLADKQILSSEGKSKASAGILKYSLGTAYTAKLVSEGKKLVDLTKSSISKTDSPLDKIAIANQLSLSATVVKNLPSLTKSLVETGNQFITFAKSSGIKTNEAQKNLAQIAGF